MVNLIDCFTFNDEIEMLNFRLHELNHVVEKFVIVESAFTFQGKEKELVFDANKEKFASFRDKIIYIIDNKPPHPNPWINEKRLRNAASIVFGKLPLSSRDLVGISDVDEIPDTNTLAVLKNVLDVDFLGFFPNFYYYNISWRKTKKLPGPVFGRVEKIYYKFNFEMDEMRNALKMADPEVKACGLRTFTDGGWHFSCFGSIDKIIKKLKSFSHHEFNKEEFTDPVNIRRLIMEGKDIVMRGPTEDLVKVQETYLPKRVDLLPQIILS